MHSPNMYFLCCLFGNIVCIYLFRFKAVASKSKVDLVKEGFTEFTIEDFHNTVSFNCTIYLLLADKPK